MHNTDGANLHYGIASALSASPRRDIAMLETDERVVADMIRLGLPEVLVLLNFSRDQLDRHHEIKALGRCWRAALAAPARRAGGGGQRRRTVDGVGGATARQVVWVDTATTWTQDASLCPTAGPTWSATSRTNGGRWGLALPGCDCPAGGDYRVVDGGSSTRGGCGARTRVPGAFNVSNAACALAAAARWGSPGETALRGMRTVTSPAGRFATILFGDTTARLLLAKNPAGWAEALPLAQTRTVILAIDSAAADGRDVSWLWDVEYEQLRRPDGDRHRPPGPGPGRPARLRRGRAPLRP